MRNNFLLAIFFRYSACDVSEREACFPFGVGGGSCMEGNSAAPCLAFWLSAGSHHNTVLAHWESSWASYGLLLQGLVCLAPSNWNYCLITCCRAPVGALCLLILGALQDFSGTCKPQGRWGWDARWACMSSTQLSPEACRQSGLMKENAINFPLRICCSSLLCLTVA